MKDKKLTMNIGIISFMVVFIILCLITFSVLSLVSAQSNKNLTNKSVEHTQEYYQLSSQAEKSLKKIDEYLYKAYQNSSTQNEYFNKAKTLTSLIDRSTYKQDLFHFDIANESYCLHIELKIQYPGQQLYEIKTWVIQPNSEWNPDQSLEVL